MATTKTLTILTLELSEALALKKLLGSMNDNQFAEFGIIGGDRQLLREVYYLLPDKEEE